MKHPVSGGKVGSLATLSGWKNPNDLNTFGHIGFQAWVRWLYNLEERETLTKEEIKKFLIEQYGSTENILKLNQKQI